MFYRVTITYQAKVFGLLALTALVLLLFTSTVYIIPLIYIIIGLYIWLSLNAFYISQAMQQLSYQWDYEDTLWVDQISSLKLMISNQSSINLQKVYVNIRYSHGLSDTLFLQLSAQTMNHIHVQITPKEIGLVHIWGLEISCFDDYLFSHQAIRKALPLQLNVRAKPRQVFHTIQPYSQAIIRQVQQYLKINHHEGEFQELKLYHSSDDQRQIAWKASAKRNQLLVKKYQPPQNIQRYIALDVSWVMRQSGFEASRLKVATQIAHYLLHTQHTNQNHQGTGIILFDDQIIACLTPEVALQHKYNLLEYAHHIVHAHSTEVTQAQLWSHLGDYLDWNGVGQVKLPLNKLSQSSYAHHILDRYQTREILTYLRTQQKPVLPLGLTPFSDKQIEQELRSYCWDKQIPLPYKLIDTQQEQKTIIKTLIQKLKQLRATHVTFLTHSQRFAHSQTLNPLLYWHHQGGQISWYQVGSHEYSYPQILAPLRKAIQIYPIKFENYQHHSEIKPFIRWSDHDL